MRKGYILVEGHGEVTAVGNLVTRLCVDLGVDVNWAPPLRWKNLHQQEGLEKGAEFIRRHPDAEALLVLRQADVPCMGTLERALLFLASATDPGGVYP